MGYSNPRVAVFTLTRDRLEFTQICLASLRDRAGYPFDHFVIDNGSEDGTQEWLTQEAKASRIAYLETLSENRGISYGRNRAIDIIQERGGYDLIIKFDNDCRVLTEDILGRIAGFYQHAAEDDRTFVISPRVVGIVNQPARHGTGQEFGEKFGLTGVVGGLFQVVPSSLYDNYRFPKDLPLALGGDAAFAKWLVGKASVGYLEDLVVEHYLTTEGQVGRYPDYFTRKYQEEDTYPNKEGS